MFERSRLVWYDRGGQSARNRRRVGEYRGIALSPDGRHVAVHDTRRRPAAISGFSIWIGRNAVHAPDSRTGAQLQACNGRQKRDRIMYVRNTGAGLERPSRQASGAGQEELVFDGPGLEWPTDWSPDGTTGPDHSWDTREPLTSRRCRLTGDRTPVPLVHHRELRAEDFATFSPDGRWIAYVSDETGRDGSVGAVVPGVGRQMAGLTGGGNYPRWARNGSELFYLTGDGTLMAVAVDTAGSAHSGRTRRVPLFTADFVLGDSRRRVSRYAVRRGGGRRAVPDQRAREPCFRLSERTERIDRRRCQLDGGAAAVGRSDAPADVASSSR